MEVNVLLLCYNESPLIPHVVKHYKKYMPSCKITIYDNESTDNSVELAKSLGCSVVSWSSENINNESIKMNMKDNVWKDIKSGWVIMADMDEFLCVTEAELLEEMNNGTTILNIDGYDMIGETKTLDLSDIDLQEIKKCVYNKWETKKLCFLRDKITDMHYAPGAHDCWPQGTVKYSSKTYINKHMSSLGLEYFINKHLTRYSRSAHNRSLNRSVHYRNDIKEVEKFYMDALNNSKTLD